jgi:hypothetical protein
MKTRLAVRLNLRRAEAALRLHPIVTRLVDAETLQQMGAEKISYLDPIAAFAVHTASRAVSSIASGMRLVVGSAHGSLRARPGPPADIT